MRFYLKKLVVGVACLGAFAGIYGQSLERIALDQEAKLEDALKRLSELRLEIKKEQIPLARELAAKEARSEELQSAVDDLRRLRDSRAVELEALRARVMAEEAQISYVRRTLLPDYLADYDAALSMGERGLFAESIREYNLLLEDPASDAIQKLERGLALLQESKTQLSRVFGGQRFAGKALSQEGILEQGTFLQIGPLSYFSSNDSDLAGLVEETQALDARVLPLDKGRAAKLATIVETGSGVLPVDPTLGDAFAIEATQDSFLENLEKGGVWVYPILLFALASTLVALWKSAQVLSIRHPKPMVIHEIISALREGRTDKAHKIAMAQPQPARDMLVSAVEHSGESAGDGRGGHV